MKKLVLLVITLVSLLISANADGGVFVKSVEPYSIVVENASGLIVNVTDGIKLLEKEKPLEVSAIEAAMNMAEITFHLATNESFKIETEKAGLYTVVVLKDGKPFVLKQVEVKGGIKIPELSLPANVSASTGKYTLKEMYLKSEKHVELTEEIKQKAQEIVSNKEDKSRAIYEWVRDNIEYDYEAQALIKKGQIPEKLGATHALIDRKGMCYDVAALYTAMARSQGIPSSLVVGSWKGEFHSWSMAWVDGKWIAVDTLANVYGELPTDHILLGDYKLN
jgi:hypothetical protein